MAADSTLDELCEEPLGVLDRLLPWRRRAIVQRAMQKKIDRMAETVNGIIQDHELDDLMNDIERTRAQGEAAMEAEHDRRKADHSPAAAKKPRRQ